ncbi:MAG: UDP-N-acetylenolpyruvoylglucosamine reductase [Gammaproteobacteria bacterium]|nr:MAG: UDP-N-acetylenolpyruvoylglucosamine reductase [Gammaproteobacteria bacterium]
MPENLSYFTTFKTGSTAKHIIILNNTNQLLDLTKQLSGNPFIVLGSGSNVLFVSDYPGSVIINRLRGIEIINENDHRVIVRVAAGEIWHDIVESFSRSGYYGLENLALIPGTVGAAPVQNIGAYGVEISNFVQSVSAFDLKQEKIIDIHHDNCAFSYRNSRFKSTEWRLRYLITAVTLILPKQFSPVLSYQGLSQPDKPKTAKALLDRIVAIRQNKLPDPDILANAGSFFKNPVVERQQLIALQEKNPTIPYFDIDAERVKIPTAWLIEQVGFKGICRDNGAGVYEKHALILVNHGNASGKEIYALACDIMQSVKAQFDIVIEPEVRII